MNLDPMMVWNIIITVVLGPFAWAFSKLFSEVNRLQILLRNQGVSVENRKQT